MCAFRAAVSLILYCKQCASNISLIKYDYMKLRKKIPIQGSENSLSYLRFTQVGVMTLWPCLQ